MHHFKFLKAIGIILIFILSACTFTSTRLNREEDKNDAEKIATKYYSLIKAKNFDATYPLFNDEFWKVTTKEKLKEMLTSTQNKLGGLENTKLDHWETKVVSGTDPSSEYILYYLNKYEKYEAKETLRLVKGTDEQIRIIAFNINSDGFFK